jgi:DNA mismatch repair protein MSH5
MPIAGTASSRPCPQARTGPFIHTSSTHAPSEALQGSDIIAAGDANDDTLNEIIMAVDMTQRRTIGCCYYVARDEKLYFMEDIQLGDVNVVDAREWDLVRLKIVTLTCL